MKFLSCGVGLSIRERAGAEGVPRRIRSSVPKPEKSTLRWHRVCARVENAAGAFVAVLARLPF